MFWDDADTPVYEVPGDVVDVSFRIRCPVLPLDHAYALSHAVLTRLPWLKDEPTAGIHPIRGAESGNGWERPSDPKTDVLHLAKRTRLRLRLPSEREAAASGLCGAVLDVAGYSMEVGAATTRNLAPSTTLFARHVSCDVVSEEEFLEWAAARLHDDGAAARKILCGRRHTLHTPDGSIGLRSLLVAGLTPEESIRAQQSGLGDFRHLGCGLFVPYKGIAPVKSEESE